MPASKLTHVPCPACDGRGRVVHRPVLRGRIIGLAFWGYSPCFRCWGSGEVPNELSSFQTVTHFAPFIYRFPHAIDERLERLAEEVAQLEEMCNHGVITTEEFGDAIRDLLRT
jgi:hypothetical protein